MIAQKFTNNAIKQRLNATLNLLRMFDTVKPLIVRLFAILVMVFIAIYSYASESKNGYQHSKLNEIPFHNVAVTDQFWLSKIKTIQTVTLPLLIDLAEKQGKIDNFRIIAGKKTKGRISLHNAPDSDIYKLIEAAGYSLSQIPDSALEARIDQIIELILLAQDSNGYLHTQYMLPLSHPCSPDTTILSNKNKIKTFGYGPECRWTSAKSNWPYAYSQLYCAGHFMEAAVAYYKGTGKDAFLKGAIKFADHICDVFDIEKIKCYADHPEIEIGLMKIHEIAGKIKYANTAEWFVRYVNFSRPVDINTAENSKPFVDQCSAYGHCVRTAYIYTGATEVVRVFGSTDLKHALDTLWKSVASRKMYIHGGIGNGTIAEQHGEDYDLPIYPTYSECCASIAQSQWNHSLNLLTGNAVYADAVEHEMYNSALSGISIDGSRFFYSNKINIGENNRENRHSGVRETYLFCCPSKLPGFVTGIGRWCYATSENAIYVNQYVGSAVNTYLEAEKVSFNLKTGYPWNGNSVLTITQNSSKIISFNFRIPYWVRSQSFFDAGLYSFERNKNPKVNLILNGKVQKVDVDEFGYVSIARKWKNGDKIEIDFEMPVQRVYTSPKVKQNTGRVALMRGPMLYCLEGVDNVFDVQKFVLPKDAVINILNEKNILDNATILSGIGIDNGQAVLFKAIPYYLWQNRGVYPMSLLLIEQQDKIFKEREETNKVHNTNG